MPQWIAAVLDSRIVSRLARVVLTFMFWSSGIAKILDWNSGIGDMTHFHLNPPVLFNVATIVVQLGGSALLIWGRWAWLGAGALAVFTVLTIPIAHDFWAMTGPRRMGEMYVAVEHISICGALVLAAIVCRKEEARL
ncbi:MAG TPA: DoxX family protein [Caulobacteraceae bacterium]|jgi:transmembrane protein|nr:DoxX family protein [Caulobacteraceae bacterium]